MKSLWNTLVLTLAINFIVLAGLVGWLYQSGHLDRKRGTAIKEILFPAPVPAPATQPSTPDGPTPAAQRLQGLLSKHSAGRSATEQVEFIQQAFDATTAQLDRREREVSDREQQVASTNSKLADDRKVLEGERARLKDQERLSERLASDKGFQDTLSLYNAMPSKQVKGVFMSMDDTAAAEYLDAMQPRTATKILKEFKAADEAEQMKRILEKMRHPPAIAGASPQPAKE